MPTKSRSRSAAKSRTTKKQTRPLKQLSRLQRLKDWPSTVKARIDAFLNRRPHRSFRRTRRRDYVAHLPLPTYTVFTFEVGKFLRANWRLFGVLVLVFTFFSSLITGLSGQSNYSTIQELIKEAGGELFTGGAGKLGEAGLLLAATVTSGSTNLQPDQQVYTGFVFLMSWLVTVWLIREIMAGAKPRFRDGLYNAGAPIVSTGAVVLLIALQLIPVGLVALAYTALSTSGVIENGFGAMLFGMLAISVVLLVLYWTVTSFIALVIVTLPGMYPIRAMKAAGDLVVGIRFPILLRLLWMVLMVLLAWLVVMVPLVVLDGWLKGMWSWYENIAVIPALVTFASTITLVWCAAYIYLLYRRLVEYGAGR